MESINRVDVVLTWSMQSKTLSESGFTEFTGGRVKQASCVLQISEIL